MIPEYKGLTIPCSPFELAICASWLNSKHLRQELCQFGSAPYPEHKLPSLAYNRCSVNIWEFADHIFTLNFAAESV